MSEPCRLLEDASSEIEAGLLRAGASYRCSEHQREKVLAALGLMGAAGVGSAAATFSLRHLLDAGPVPWIAGLSIIGLAAAVPVSIMLSHAEPSRQAMPKVMTALTATEIPTLSRQPERGAPTTQSTSEIGVQPGPADLGPGGVNRGRLAQQAQAQRRSKGLTEELRALDEARALLGSGQPNAALTRLDSYAREYPAGHLALEAEVIRIDALAQSGRSAAAEKRAALFLSQHPKSVLASRVRRHLRE